MVIGGINSVPVNSTYPVNGESVLVIVQAIGVGDEICIGANQNDVTVPKEYNSVSIPNGSKGITIFSENKVSAIKYSRSEC
jgi:hypothetical protein